MQLDFSVFLSFLLANFACDVILLTIFGNTLLCSFDLTFGQFYVLFQQQKEALTCLKFTKQIEQNP